MTIRARGCVCSAVHGHAARTVVSAIRTRTGAGDPVPFHDTGRGISVGTLLTLNQPFRCARGMIGRLRLGDMTRVGDGSEAARVTGV